MLSKADNLRNTLLSETKPIITSHAELLIKAMRTVSSLMRTNNSLMRTNGKQQGDS